MAIYHLHVKVLTRSAGHSAIAAAAYRRAARMTDKSESKVYNYNKKSEVEFSEILIPENSPEWIKAISEEKQALGSEKLWNIAEQTEVRINSQLAREIEFSLPIELTAEQNIELARNFIKGHIVSRGMIADWSFHNKQGNPHVHVMMPTRMANEHGFGEKVREWNSRSVLNELRKSWADIANEVLQKHEHDVRIDHRSYKEADIDLIPQVHLGPVEKMEKRNISTDIMSIYLDNNAKNLTIIADNPQTLIAKISNQKATFGSSDIATSLYNYSKGADTRYSKNRGINEPDNIQVDPALFAKPSSDIEFLNKMKIAALLDRIEYHDSVFTLDKVERELKDVVANYKQLARAIVAVKNADNVISLGFGDDGRERFTTANMLALERDIQANVIKLKANVFTLLPDKVIAKVLTDYELLTGKKLTEEQNRAVRHIVGCESISCIVGRAGTGKSFSLAAAKAVWDSQGNEVYGVALSGIAADGLTKDAGLNSRTIASFLLSVEANSIKLSNNSIVVMDEAGMTDSYSMQKIVKLTEEAGAKLVLVGDPAQLQPVGPGASFRAILEKTGFAEIQTVYRQQEEWQRAATVQFSQSNTQDGIQTYYDNGCVHMLNNANEAVNKLALDWSISRTKSVKDISKYLVIAHRNADVQLLNNTLRSIRVSSGEIDNGYLVKNEVAGKEREIRLSQGERIVFLKNYKELGLANGRFATVTYVNYSKSGQIIDFNVRLDGNSKEVTINPTSCNNFDYGYAATVHKTQGVTVDHSFVYGGGNLNSSLTYVAMTRHKETTGLYVSNEQYKTLEQLKERVSRVEVKDSVLNYLNQVDDFAGRRGLDTNLKTLKKIITDSLSKARDRIVDLVTGQKINNLVVNAVPENDTLNQQAVNEAAVTVADQAKLVAEYAAQRKQVGQAYEALKPKLAILGLDKISYEEKQFTTISQIPEYQDMQRMNLELHKLAYKINSNLELSSQAIALNRLDIEKIKAYAAKHEVRVRVEKYAGLIAAKNADEVPKELESCQTKDSINQCRKLAHEINMDIPGHFKALREYQVNLDLVKANAQQYIFDQVANSKVEAKFTSFDITVKEYLQLEIKGLSINQQLKNRNTEALLAEKANFKAGLDNYIKQFEAKYGQELAQHSGQDKAVTISSNGGFIEIYTRCLDNKLTDNDLSAISRMVAYQQVKDLVVARNSYIAANNKSKPVFEECKASNENYVLTPEFAELLNTQIAYAEAVTKVAGIYNEIERALSIYNIKPEELESYYNGLSNHYTVKAGLDYVTVGQSDGRCLYKAAFELSQGNTRSVIKIFNIDEKQVQQQVKELVSAYILTKHGLTELATKSPAREYIDIVATAASKADTVLVDEEHELQKSLTEYVETSILYDKLLYEVRIKENKQLESQYKIVQRNFTKLKSDIASPNIQNALNRKYSENEFNFRNRPEYKGGIEQVYQRLIQGKSTTEDYAALKREFSQNITQQQNLEKSIKW